MRGGVAAEDGDRSGDEVPVVSPEPEAVDAGGRPREGPEPRHDALQPVLRSAAACTVSLAQSAEALIPPSGKKCTCSIRLPELAAL